MIPREVAAKCIVLQCVPPNELGRDPVNTPRVERPLGGTLVRSRIAHVGARMSVVSAGLVAASVSAAPGAVATSTHTTQVAAQVDPLDALGTPVGLGAVAFGVIGMVAGVFRKKKIHPENQRK